VIAHLRGQLIAKSDNQAVVECAGVGYCLTISSHTFHALPRPGEQVALHVYTHVREDQLALYGFLRPEEKQLFERLLSISGVGPGMARNLLSFKTVPELVAALRGRDVQALVKIPKVGQKTAERLVLELHDKLDSFGVEAQPAPQASPLEEDVLSALLNLGYQRAASERALAKARAHMPDESAFEKLFRCALENLSR